MTNNVSLIQSMYDAFGKGDVAYIVAKVADNVEWTAEGPSHVPFFRAFRGPAGVARFFEALATTQTDQRLTIEEIFGVDDKVVSVGRYACTVLATGKKVDAKTVHVFSVNDGKVTRFLNINDTAQLADAYPSATAHAA